MAPTYPLRRASLAPLHISSCLAFEPLSETIGYAKEGMKLGCDAVGFVDGESGCLVEALRRENGRGETGFVLCMEAFPWIYHVA